MQSIQRTQNKEERKRELAYIYGVGATDGRSNKPKDPKKTFNDRYCQVAYDLGYEQCHDRMSKSSDEIIKMVEYRISGSLAPNKTKPNPDMIDFMNLHYGVMWDIYAFLLIGGVIFGFLISHLYYDELAGQLMPEWLFIMLTSILSSILYVILVNSLANGNPFKLIKKYKLNDK